MLGMVRALGHGEGAEVDLSEASAAVAKAVAMDRKGKTLLERVEPIMSNLEKLFDNHPNFETVYRGPDGNYHPGPAEIITKAMVCLLYTSPSPRD